VKSPNIVWHPSTVPRAARAGEIKAFTAISSPYEQAETPEHRIGTGSQNLVASVAQVINHWLPKTISPGE